MSTLEISTAKKEFTKLANECIKKDDVVTISTDEGSVVMLSEKQYNSLVDSLYQYMKKDVIENVRDAVMTKTEDLTDLSLWD